MDKTKLQEIRTTYNKAKEALRNSNNLESVEAEHLGLLLNILSDMIQDKRKRHQG